MSRFAAIVRVVARRPVPVLIVVGVLALGAAALALRLEPSVSTNQLVSSGSDSARATQDFHDKFGDDSVVILVKGNLQRTVLTADLGRLIRLEGCLSGNGSASEFARVRAAYAKNPDEGLPPVCAAMRKLHPAKVVLGPGTFINTSANEIVKQFSAQSQLSQQQAQTAADQAAAAVKKKGGSKAAQRRAASQAANAIQQRFRQTTIALALRYGLTSIPRVDDPDFVSTLVFDPDPSPNARTAQVGQPKSRFAFIFPSRDAALVQVRLRPDLSDAQRRRAIDLIRDVVKQDTFRPRNGAKYVVTGVPVVTQGLATAVQHSIFVLLGAALLVMAATLAAVFRSRMRLLPLLLALVASALTFGALALVGGTLTMASIAVLPVLIGLAVDYAIQFQARYDEARPGARDPGEAAAAAAAAGGPTIATAGLATAAGFLVLLLSPVPMVRGFGALLVLGIGLALACALTAGFAVLVRFGDRTRPDGVPPTFPRVRRRLGASRLAARAGHRWANVREGVAHRSQLVLAYSLRRPRKVLAVGLVVAVAGLAADTQSTVVSDIQQLVPRDLGALRDVNDLQRQTGVSGEIDVTVKADDLTDPSVIRWMARFEASALKKAGYRAGDTCRQEKNPPDLCPAPSLPDILNVSSSTTQAQVQGLLKTIPTYFSQGVVTRDRKTAVLGFGIRLMPLDRQKRVVDSLESQLHPPKGVQASVVGLPVLAAQANDRLSSPLWRGLTLVAALLAVFLVLFAVRRRARDAAVPLIPIALATGWSGLVLFVLGLLPGWVPIAADLNPMSATLGALVIAISTEFSVLLSARYAQERAKGATAGRAMELTYRSTGRAVVASGVTAIAGFAALIVSNITMLHDFGIVTVVDLTLSLLGVLVVLPAALVWAEQHGPFTLADLDPRPLARELWAGRRLPALPRPRVPRFSVRLPLRRRS